MSKSYRINSNVAVATVGVGSRKAGNTGGALTRISVHDTFENPPVIPTSEGATCTLVTTVAASAGGVALTIVAAVEALLRYQPRNLAIWASAAQTEILSVVGTDQFGNAQTEDITFNGNAKVEGTKVWGSISALNNAARSGAANIGVGFGPLFGTSRKIVAAVDGYVGTTASGGYAMVRETTEPLKSTTASVHAVTFATAIAADKTYEVRYITDEAR
jgi:hypothetical protein